AFGSVLRPRNHWLCGRAGSNCLSGFKTGYCAQNFAAITKDNAEVFQVLIGQVRKDGEINAAFSKTLSVLGHAELFEPVSNLLHWRPPTDFALSVLDRQDRKSSTCTNFLQRPGEGALQAGALRASARFNEEGGCARKNNPDFGELAGLRIDLYRPRMLLHDDVVSDGQAKASALASRFCCEERIEHLILNLRWNAGAVVANPNLNFI